MSAAEPAFKGAGAAPGMELWRIENMVPVKVKEAPGKFFQGDSYILLVTTASKRYQLSMHGIPFIILSTRVAGLPDHSDVDCLQRLVESCDPFLVGKRIIAG